MVRKKKATNGAAKLNNKVATEVSDALETVKGWGSVEIFVQNNKIVQITSRSIKKIQHRIK